MLPGSLIIPFRGGKKINDHFLNARSAWWWALRKRFERGGIAMQVIDPKTDAQLSQMCYSITNIGAIRVETKEEMRNRGLISPDRADTCMYTFAFSEDLPNPDIKPEAHFVVTEGYAVDNSEDAMWSALDNKLKAPHDVNVVTGVPDLDLWEQ
jgi:hypothetical protein